MRWLGSSTRSRQSGTVPVNSIKKHYKSNRKKTNKPQNTIHPPNNNSETANGGARANNETERIHHSSNTVRIISDGGA